MMAVTLELMPEFGNKLVKHVDKIKQYADELELEEIWLFGSVARGTYSRDSDIDLMLVTKGDTRRVRRLVDEYGLDDELDEPFVEITVRTRESLENPAFLFNTMVKQDRIVLWRRDE